MVQGTGITTNPELHRDVLDFISRRERATENQFNDLALRLFEIQILQNPFYRTFCELQGRSAPARWQDIPAVPTSAFKRTAIRSFPASQDLTYFQTSGTTEGDSGRHYFQTLQYYDAAIVPNFKSHLLPDTDRVEMLILTPPPSESPHSSLVHMMDVVRREFGTAASDWYMIEGALETEKLIGRLKAVTVSGDSVFLLGTAFAFVYLIDALDALSLYIELPSGSRIMETGGFKGRTREIARDDLYAMLQSRLGIPTDRIINEYGMTELSSQFYDRSLQVGSSTPWKAIPHWTRVQIVDPLTGQRVPDNQSGLIQITDLANVGSVISIRTEDIGLAQADTFQVSGRVSQAQPRGCSLAVE